MKNIATFILLCSAGLGRIAVGQEHPGSMDSVRFSIDNCIHEFDSTKVEKTDAGSQFWFVDKNFLDGRTLKMSVVAPHKATHPPHMHVEDEFFFVLEGTAEFFLDGKKKIVGPMTSLYCPSQMQHGIRNVGATTLKYLVIKKYQK